VSRSTSKECCGSRPRGEECDYASLTLPGIRWRRSEIDKITVKLAYILGNDIAGLSAIE